jgi:hypothetical protein
MGGEGLGHSRLADFEAVLLKEPGYTGLLRRLRILGESLSAEGLLLVDENTLFR